MQWRRSGGAARALVQWLYIPRSMTCFPPCFCCHFGRLRRGGGKRNIPPNTLECKYSCFSRWKCLHKWILKSPKVTLKREDTWVRKRCVKIPNNNTSNPSGNNATWNSTRPKYRQFPCIIRVCKRARYKALLEPQKVTAKRSMSCAVYCKMSWQSLPIRTPNHFRTPESSYIGIIYLISLI